MRQIIITIDFILPWKKHLFDLATCAPITSDANYYEIRVNFYRF